MKKLPQTHQLAGQCRKAVSCKQLALHSSSISNFSHHFWFRFRADFFSVRTCAAVSPNLNSKNQNLFQS